MARTRTYYCNACKKTKDFTMNESHICDCGYAFGMPSNNTKSYINMRTTWSGQSKVEFSQQTIKESVEGMGGTW